MWEKIGLCISCFIILFSAAGCGEEAASLSSNKQHQQDKLVIGTMPDIDSLPLVIAQEKGFFAEEGINVELQQFKSAMDRDAALQSGNLDGAVSDVLAVAFAKDGGFGVSVTSFTDGSYKLVASTDSGITTPQDLSGKDVAISRNTIIEYVTDHILVNKNISEAAINKVIIPQIPVRLEMLQNGKLDAATLPEPMAGIAVSKGCRYITGSDELDINPGVMMFTNDAINQKKAQLQAMYRAYNKAVNYLNNTPPSEYMDIVLDKGGFPAGAQDSMKLPVYRLAGLPKEKDIKDCLKWMYQKELIKTQYNYTDFIVDILHD